MTPIFPLISGFSDCPTGTAEFYRYGTNEPLIVYDDDEEPIGTSVTLDSAGRYVVLTAARAEVVVKTSAGVQKARFPFNVADNVVELENASFDGTLATGSQGAGGKTLLSTKLALMSASFGARNFSVRKTGGLVDQLLKDALVALTGQFYNVKDYGALGDGVTDDRVAIQAAISAAETAGGGVVFFPWGNYFCAAALLITSQKITLMGVTHRASVITNTAVAGNGISISSGSAVDCGILIQNLGIVAQVASTGIGIAATVCNGLELRNVRIAGHATGVKADSRIIMRGGSITTPTSGTVYCVQFDSAGSGENSELLGVDLAMVSVDAGMSAVLVQRADIRIENCRIDVAAGAATSKCINVNHANGIGAVVKGNRFTAGASNYGLYIDANVGFYELGNRAVSGTLFGASATLVTATPQVRLSQQWASASASQSGGTYNPSQDVAYHYVENTNGGGGTINITPSGGTPTHGARMVIAVKNAGGGGNQGVTFGAGTIAIQAATMVTGNGVVFEIIYNATAGTTGWDIVATHTATNHAT